jgi:serine protease Do
VNPRTALVALGVLATALAACKTRLGSGSGTSTSGLPSGAVPVLSYTPPPASPPVALVPAGVPTSFADLAAKCDQAVVFVKALQEGRRQINEAVGTAFVFDPNGLILTNNHVIEHATEIRVTFGGQKKEMPATVVGRDRPTDIAVLRVEATGLAHVPLGDSGAVRVGDWAVAIGNPFGLSHTVSVGIISAKGRTNQDVRGLDESGYYDFLQTDASINPGNSGGPLLDVAGRAIGINTAIRPQANSIGFAVPIDMVKELLPRLLKDGRIRRSAIGVVVSTVQAADVTRLRLPSETGALIRLVAPGGPADRAGLQPEDVIVGLGPDPIVSPERLRWIASLAGVGSKVPVRVIREGRTFEVTLELQALPEAPGRDE